VSIPFRKTDPTGKKQTVKAPFTHKDFVGLNWIGFSGSGDAGAIMHIDNVSIRIKPAR